MNGIDPLNPPPAKPGKVRLRKFMVETVEVYVVTHVVMAEDAEDAVEQAMEVVDFSALPIEYRNRGGIGRVLEQAS